MIAVAPRVYTHYPTVCFGVLHIEGFAPRDPNTFSTVRDAEIAALRARHAGYRRAEFVQTEPTRSYVKYYKRFQKTYHVLQQLESIVLKDKTIPDAHPLVQALLLTEVQHMLLIACHDLDTIQGPLTIDVADGGEPFRRASGSETTLDARDICMREGDEFILSIIYGQDSRTRIAPHTRNALYLIDGVEGVTASRMMEGLHSLLGILRAFDPDLQPVHLEVIRPDGG